MLFRPHFFSWVAGCTILWNFESPRLCVDPPTTLFVICPAFRLGEEGGGGVCVRLLCRNVIRLNWRRTTAHVHTFTPKPKFEHPKFECMGFFVMISFTFIFRIRIVRPPPLAFTIISFWLKPFCSRHLLLARSVPIALFVVIFDHGFSPWEGVGGPQHRRDGSRSSVGLDLHQCVGQKRMHGQWLGAARQTPIRTISPEIVLEEAKKKVAGIEAALAALSSVGATEGPGCSS